MKKIYFIISILIAINLNFISAQVYYTQKIITPNDTDTRGYKDESFIFHVHQTSITLENDLEKINMMGIRNHPLGKEVAIRMHLLEESYTYISEAAPGAFSGKRNIQKPVIYHSIKKIEKHIKRQIRRDKISKVEGENILCRFIEVSIILIDLETGDLERILKNTDSTKEILNIYRRIKFKTI